MMMHNDRNFPAVFIRSVLLFTFQPYFDAFLLFLQFQPFFLQLLFLFFFLFFCLDFLHITAHKRNFLNDFFD
mgnify:CR=1 FL=1